MGISPAGATPASFMSYGIAKKVSRDGDKFGTGMVEGVVAPETAAHAAGTSALGGHEYCGHDVDSGGATASAGAGCTSQPSTMKCA